MFKRKKKAKKSLIKTQDDFFINDYISSLNLDLSRVKKQGLLISINETVYGGKRSTSLIPMLDQMGVDDSKSVALTLNGIAHSMYLKDRAVKLGLKGYIWKTAGDIRVRETHGEMHNVICLWNNRPKLRDSNRESGTHPGESDVCRCIAVTIVTKSQVEEIATNGIVKLYTEERIQEMSVRNAIVLLGLDD